MAVVTVFRLKSTIHKISHNHHLPNTRILILMTIRSNKMNQLLKSIKSNKKELKSNLTKNPKEICS